MAESSGSSAGSGMFVYQAPATLDQAAPVQNTWYTVLDTTKNCRLIGVGVRVATTGETLAVRITIDGQTPSGSNACNADTDYWADMYLSANTGQGVLISTTAPLAGRGFMIEGKSIKVEVRKTTAAGAGNLKACVLYAKVP